MEKALAMIDKWDNGLPFETFGFGVECLDEMISAEFVDNGDFCAKGLGDQHQ